MSRKTLRKFVYGKTSIEESVGVEWPSVPGVSTSLFLSTPGRTAVGGGETEREHG